MSNEETLDATEAAYLRKYVAELEAELARLRPLAELYPLAWEECEWHREGSKYSCEECDTSNGKPCHAHDKARAERGVE
jgi:hypothetical protein